MVKVVIVNGMPESGKTTFQYRCIDKLKKLGYNAVIISSIDWVKEIALSCGWNGVKNDKNRKFLSDLKKLLTDWDDAVLKHLINDINYYHYQTDNTVIFIDIREPDEIKRAEKLFNASSVIVRRPQVECNHYNNSSDMNVFNHSYDYTLQNDKGIDELDSEIDNFIRYMIVENSEYIYNVKENCDE
jgi:tRNA uridine 5-carbamoylmethylation protein Kti12